MPRYRYPLVVALVLFSLLSSLLPPARPIAAASPDASTAAASAATLASQEPVFYRAINLGGPALTIDGHSWAGSDALDYTTNGYEFCNPSVSLIPPPNAARAEMLRCSVWQNWLELSVTEVPAGIYQVSLYTWEDNDSETFDLALEQTWMVQNHESGTAGTGAA